MTYARLDCFALLTTLCAIEIAALAPVEWLRLHFVYSTPVEWKRFNWAGRARRLARNDWTVAVLITPSPVIAREAATEAICMANL